MPAPRLILNDDGSNFLYSCDHADASDLRAYLERLEGTRVDMVCYCVAFGGYVAYYDSEIADPIGTGFAVGMEVKRMRCARNRVRLREQVGDYIGHAFAILAEMGIPTLASIRMNDAHMSGDPVGPVAGRFWMNHPQWRLGEPYGYFSSCLDYTYAPVREYLRRLVGEVIQRYPDIAGIELDALRSPFFFRPEEGREKAPIMTEFIAQIREDLAAAASRQGRQPYQLRLNVPRCPELCLDTGLDIAAWAELGLVDGIAPGCYNSDFQLPFERWRDLLGDALQLHAYINCSPGAAQYMSRENYRAAAANSLDAGADGIYLFNFPCLDELALLTPVPFGSRPFPAPEFRAQCWHPDLVQSRDALSELGNSACLARADKHYLYYMHGISYRHYTPERASIQRLEPEPADLQWRCADDPAAPAVYEISLKLVALSTADEFAFDLNGEPVSPGCIERLHSANGRDARLHPEPLDPYSLYRITPDRAHLRKGRNILTVTLLEGDPDLLGEIEVRELEVTVRYGE